MSRHVQVLVQAGLVQQERTGRIARCSLEVGPLFAAAAWINEYSQYWQAQFDLLAVWRWTEIGAQVSPGARGVRRRRGLEPADAAVAGSQHGGMTMTDAPDRFA